MKINYVKGDATLPQGDGRKIIAHICNDQGAWGAGFVMALSARDIGPEQAYRQWELSDTLHVPTFRLGEIQIVPFDQPHQLFTWVCNMIAQILSWEKRLGAPTMPLRPWALRSCLKKLNEQAKYGIASVHMPRIGCGLAGGTWNIVEPIIQETLVDVPVTVYDL